MAGPSFRSCTLLRPIIATNRGAFGDGLVFRHWWTFRVLWQYIVAIH
jgi:hypothetical protein